MTPRTTKKTEAEADAPVETPDVTPAIDPADPAVAGVPEHDEKPVDGEEPLEGTPDPVEDVAPAGFEEPGEPDPADAVAHAEERETLRLRGSGPQAVEGYEPPAPPDTGKTPPGFPNRAFAMTTGPTSPSIAEQVALSKVADHFPDDVLDELDD